MVDRHALLLTLSEDRRQALDSHYSQGATKVLERAGAYDYVASAYRHTAQQLGLRPHALQATTWLAWRRLQRAHRPPSTFSTFEVPALPELDDDNGFWREEF